jgi:cytochrome P450
LPGRPRNSRSTRTPRAAKCPFAPPPELLELHGAGKAVHRVKTWDGTTPWLVTGHAAQGQILTDPRVSADLAAPGYPHTTEAMKAHAAEVGKSINNTDGPEHARWRRMLTSSFTRHRMEKLRPVIQQITDDLIDKMLAGPKPVDLNEVLSLPLPSLMICELLGVPYEDHDYFQKYAGVTNARFKTPEEAAETITGLRRYIAELITKRRTLRPRTSSRILAGGSRKACSPWRRPPRWGSSFSSPAMTPAPT